MQRLVVGLGLLVTLAVASGPLLAASGLTTEQRIQRLERRVAKVTDLTLAMDAMRAENSRLRGEIENLQHQMEQLKRKQRDIYLDIDQRLSAMQAGGAASQAGATAAAPPAATVATPPKPVDDASGGSVQVTQNASADSQQMQADYKAAYALLSPQVRRYDDAAKAFTAFLAKYPDSPLAANAQYWLGEAYYVSQRNEKALAAFSGLVADYSKSAKVPGALYKIGRIQLSDGDKVKAAETLQKVVDDYPSSPAAGLAREQLNKLQKRR